MKNFATINILLLLLGQLGTVPCSCRAGAPDESEASEAEETHSCCHGTPKTTAEKTPMRSPHFCPGTGTECETSSCCCASTARTDIAVVRDERNFHEEDLPGIIRHAPPTVHLTQIGPTAAHNAARYHRDPPLSYTVMRC